MRMPFAISLILVLYVGVLSYDLSVTCASEILRKIIIKILLKIIIYCETIICIKYVVFYYSSAVCCDHVEVSSFKKLRNKTGLVLCLP